MAVPKITDSVLPNEESFGAEERAFQGFIAAVAPQQTSRGDDPMAGHVARAAIAHDVSDGPRGARFTGRQRDISVSGHLTRRNTPHDREHAMPE